MKQGEFYQNINQLYLATLEGIKLQALVDKYKEY
jgi:hypothetical protein